MFGRTLLVVCLLAAVAVGQGTVAKNDYARIELKELAARPSQFQGRRVSLTANVVSVGADYQSLNVFDLQSRSLLTVSLSQLPKAQRQALVQEPVYRVTVNGRIETRKGRAILKADKVAVVVPETLAKR